MFNERVWKEGEKIAQSYMKKNGYKIKYTNFSCVGVELDIVAILPAKVQKKNLENLLKKQLKQDGVDSKILKNHYKNLINKLEDLLVICEVKSRSSDKYGEGHEAIDTKKMYHIRRGAEYLMNKSEFKDMQVRFDVASVDAGKLTYIVNAF